jgi:glycosyltransferase involved in cell wall biosynthesis
MKILVVQDGDWIKKAPHQQHHLMERLSTKGHEIIVIGYDQLWRDDKSSLISKREVFYNVCNIYKGASITFIRPRFLKLPVLDYFSFLFSSRKEIKKSIKEFNPDIVIGFTSVLSNYLGMKYAQYYHIPFIYYWTDVIHALIPFKPFQLIAKIIEKEITKNSTKVITINEGLKDYVVNFGADPITTQVISGGVDFKRFNPLKIDSRKNREKYNIAEDDLVLFFMGWIYEFSGLKEVILELSKVKNTHLNIKIMVVGEGDHYTQLKEIIDKNSMQYQVILTGKRPYEEIPQLISVADICLLPAYNNKIMKDIVPIKMYEYLAMHKPVISTKLSGVMREFGKNHGVIYVEKSEDVIQKVIRLNKEDIQRHSLMGQEFIKNYNWDNITSEFEEVLISLVEWK